MKAILLLLIYCVSLLSYSNDEIEVIYYKSHNPPFQFSNKHQTGFITHIIKSLSNVGVTFKPKTLSFKRMIKEMSTSKAHWISYGSDSWVGAQSTSLSGISLWKVEHVFFTLKSNKLEGIPSLFDQTIVLIDGYDYPGLDSYINKGLIHKVIRVQNPELAILSVLEGSADVYPDMRDRIQYYLNKMGANRKEFILNDNTNIIPEYEIKLCFSKNFPPLIKADIEIKLRNMRRLNEFEHLMSNLID
jgi:polar amino acid transport system substrate-binding protein